VLLEDVKAYLKRFVVYPSDEACMAHTLWCAHAHFMDRWDTTPRFAFLSAEPASGKTRALEVTGLLVPDPVETVNVTVSYLFRRIGMGGDTPPTVLFDEIDTVFGRRPTPGTEEVRGLINAGYRRGATAGRCVAHGRTIETEDYPAYAAVAVAGLGALPDTLLSRSIIVRMVRRAPNERIEPFRRRLHAPAGHVLRDRLAAWAKGAANPLPWPALPNTVTDRNADCWEGLIALADLAGGHWAKEARATAVTLTARAAEELREASRGLQLLEHMRAVLGEDEQKTTTAILDRLAKLDESPWAAIEGKNQDKPLSDRGLASRLRPYGIKPRVLRVGGATPRGYRKEDFLDVWRRYVGDAPLSL
jgi:hypothetical protein